jgi:hypothetical protein
VADFRGGLSWRTFVADFPQEAWRIFLADFLAALADFPGDFHSLAALSNFCLTRGGLWQTLGRLCTLITSISVR